MARARISRSERLSKLRTFASSAWVTWLAPRRYCVDRAGADHPCERHDQPSEPVAVVSVEDSARHPRREPLPERIDHDQQRQKFPNGRETKAFGGDERVDHRVRNHAE